MTGKRSGKTARSGCGLVLIGCAVTCGLLVLNRLIVSFFYQMLVPPAADFAYIRVGLHFFATIALLLPEWWLIDRITRPVR